MHRATVAHGVHEILPDIAFPVVISNFGDCEVTLRPKTAVGRVEVLATGVIALPSPAARGRAGPTRIDIPADDPSFCAAPSPTVGNRATPAPTAAGPTDPLCTVQEDEDPRAAGHVPDRDAARVEEDPRGAGPSPAGAPQPGHTGPPRVEDVPLPEAEP